MSNDSVKYLNEKCLLSACVALDKADLEEGVYEGIDIQGHVRDRLGRMLGENIIEKAADVSAVDQPGTNERVYRAEVYVLNPADMRHLYHMIRDEERKAVYAFIEGVRANGSPDAVDAANELSKRLREAP